MADSPHVVAPPAGLAARMSAPPSTGTTTEAHAVSPTAVITLDTALRHCETARFIISTAPFAGLPERTKPQDVRRRASATSNQRASLRGGGSNERAAISRPE